MSSIRRKHGSYHVLYRDAQGVQRSEKAGKTKAEAEAARASIDDALRRGRNPADANMLLEVAWSSWMRWNDVRPEGIADSTKADYESIWKVHLEPHLAAKRLRDFNTAVITRYVMERRNAGVSSARLQKVLIALRACLNWWYSQDVLREDPKRWFSTPAPHAKERPTVTVEQLEMLVAGIPDYYRPLVAFMAYTGVRLGEARGLLWGSVDLDKRLAVVENGMYRSKHKPTTKTNKTRVVGIPVHVVDMLRDWQKHCPESDLGYVFPAPSGRPLDADNFRKRVFYPARDAAGISSSFHIHDMRHSAASIMHELGTSVRDTMSFMGWSQLSTAQRYLHSRDDVRAVADRFSEARAKAMKSKSSAKRQKPTSKSELS